MKRKLTLEENIFLVKRKLIDSIYSCAKIERINVTFPETKAIVEGHATGNGNIPISEIEKILNMRNAWKYTLENIDSPLTLDYACKINGYVAHNEALKPGELRTGGVGIGGTKYIPAIPDKANVEKEINTVLSEPDATKRALKYFLTACRSQYFWDGNKRTSAICANKILIQNGGGIFIVPVTEIAVFDKTMIEFYESNNYDNALLFLNDKIQTIEF